MTQLDQLKEEIEALMSENEVVKANAIKVSATGMGDERATIMYVNARLENGAYQNVLELIERLNKTEK